MAAEILSIVAFGLTAATVATAFAEAGDFIHKRVHTFKNASEVARKIGAFGYDLHSGKQKINMKLAIEACSRSDLDDTIKDVIEDHVTKLKDLILESEYRLGKLYDSSGEVRKVYTTLIGERKAQTLVKSLEKWQSDFENTISLIEMKHRLRSTQKLSRGKLVVKEQARISSVSDLARGLAEVSDGGITRGIHVITERVFYANITDAEAEEAASTLAQHLREIPSGGGILHCLGFRKTDRFELVFELPSPACNLRTLREVVAASQHDSYGGGYSLDNRFRLARQLCNAVISIFSCELVHKSIRTDTIVLLSGMDGTESIGTPYLTSWTMLRKATGLTSGPGEGDDKKDFYRHPTRQGLQPEQRYNMGHDIYSLGVCLLEVSLWQPFFEADGLPSTMFRKTATRLGYASTDDNDALKVLQKPLWVSRVLRELAEKEVPQRMGDPLSRLIVSSLTCLEGGMGEPSYFKSNPSLAAESFNGLVSQSFEAFRT